MKKFNRAKSARPTNREKWAVWRVLNRRILLLLKAIKIGCWRFVAARGADLRLLFVLLVFTLAFGEIRLVPVDVFLHCDFAVGALVALGKGGIFPFIKVGLLYLVDLHARGIAAVIFSINWNRFVLRCCSSLIVLGMV